MTRRNSSSTLSFFTIQDKGITYQNEKQIQSLHDLNQCFWPVLSNLIIAPDVKELCLRYVIGDFEHLTSFMRMYHCSFIIHEKQVRLADMIREIKGGWYYYHNNSIAFEIQQSEDQISICFDQYQVSMAMLADQTLLIQVSTPIENLAKR